jgi:hypothetical protein
MKHIFSILALSVFLSGCGMTTQTTSGQEYLSRYKYVPVHEAYTPVRTSGKDGDVVKQVKSIDESVREAAAVEPILKFPARIGIARIENGSLTAVPLEEGESWHKLQEKLGSSFGEFVPISPLVVNMVASDASYRDSVHSIIDSIRLGAARQHLDAVLLYEIINKESSRNNIFSAANVTVLGAFILPSKLHDAEGLGNGLLIDVIQGYPYGTINTVVEKSRISSTLGWGAGSGDGAALTRKVENLTAEQLADEAYKMFVELRGKLTNKESPHD